MYRKHHFYFSRGEKQAIIILFILIVITGGTYIYIRSIPTPGDKIENFRQQEFNQFITQLKEKETQQTTQQRKKKDNASYKTVSYPYQTKLKEGEQIELNSADTSVLKQIPGIGSGYANRIVKYRNLLGGYALVTQLKEVWGMDDYLYDKIIPYIYLAEKQERIKVNRSDFKQLNKHPYISYKQAQIIIDIRERKGNIESIEQLSLLEEFTGADITRLRAYLSFD